MRLPCLKMKFNIYLIHHPPGNCNNNNNKKQEEQNLSYTPLPAPNIYVSRKNNILINIIRYKRNTNLFTTLLLIIIISRL